MNIDLSLLITPPSWLIVEVISIVLLVYVLADITRVYDKANQIVRIGEFLGFMLLVASYENIGHGASIYLYSQDRILMFGGVPLAIIIIEGAILYAGFRFIDKMDMPLWTKGFIVGMFALVQDLTMDPSAVFDLHEVNGIMEGRWNWTQSYEGKLLFGIPFFNFTGWFMQNLYYTTFILLGREYYKRAGKTTKAAITYIFTSIILSFILILTLNNFTLFMWPVVPLYTKSAEIIMLSLTIIIAVIIIFKYFKIKTAFDWKNDKIIWLVPLILHAYDILAAFILGIEQAYIPSILFMIPHLIFIIYVFKTKSVNYVK